MPRDRPPQRDERALLDDISKACRLVLRFVEGKTFDDYANDDLLRSGVERQFIIIGEAMARLVTIHTDLPTMIPEYRRVIGFRNVLTHEYGAVDDHLAWSTAQDDL